MIPIAGANPGVRRRMPTIIPGGTPAWLASMALYEYKELIGTRMDTPRRASWEGDGGTPYAGIRGVSGPRDAVGAWCTMAVDQATQRIITADQGGHQGYGGNFVAALRANQDTFNGWDELSGPSIFADLRDTNLFPAARYNLDGRPISGHGYNATVYCPERNRILLFGSAATYQNGNVNTSALYGFNLATNTWDPDGTFADCPVTPGANAIVFRDPGTGDVYMWPGGSPSVNDFYRWNQAADTWTQVWKFNGVPSQSPTKQFTSTGVDTRRRRALFLGLQPFYPTAPGPCLVNLPIPDPITSPGWVNNQTGITQVTFSGPASNGFKFGGADGINDQGYGILFVQHADPNQDFFVIRSAWVGGRTYRIRAVQELDGSLFCDVLPTIGGDGIPKGYGDDPNVGGAGIYGRFNFFETLGVALIKPEYEKNAWALRLR